MAASKFQFRIFVVGMVIILSSLLAFSPVKAETESYSGYYYMGVYGPVDQAYDDLYYGDLVIITDSENASGSIRVGGSDYEYQGTYTYYSHLALGTNNPAGIHSYSISGTFSGTATYTLQDVTLDDTQYQGLINVLNNINTNDASILSYLSTIRTDLLNAINNIDTLIDTISWTDANIQPLQYSTTFNGTLISDTGNTGVSTIYVPVSIPQSLRQTGTLYHYKLRIDSSFSGVNGDIFVTLSHALGNGDRTVVPANIFVLHNRQTVDIFIFDTYLYWQNNILEITTEQGNVHVYNTNTLFFQYLLDTDIEYWTIKQYFETHEYYNSQNTELDQPNEDLSQSVDDYIEQEDNLIDGFDNAIGSQNVDPANLPASNPANWGVEFVGSLNMIGMVFNQLTGALTGGNPVYMLMNFSLMLGLALLIIGKRG